MAKQYREIDFSWGSSIEGAVNELLAYKNKGELVCGEFNGVILYSDTVTMDNAYKKIVGKTKAEFDESQRQWREEYNRKERKHKERVLELTKFWEAKGREVLTEDKWDRWNEIVPIRLNDLYHGMELGDCLDIVDILNNNGSLDEAKRAIDNQGHSGMSYGLVCAMVKEFCDRGQEFVEHLR